MTTYSITSEVIDGSVVYGPYAAPGDSAWIKVKLNSVVDNPTPSKMFDEPVTALIEKSIDSGGTWTHYGHIVWWGDDISNQTPRDEYVAYAEYWISINEDGGIYRVTLTTDASNEIFGQIEFDTTDTRPGPYSTGTNIGIEDYYRVVIKGSGGHGVSFAYEASGPVIPKRNDNSAILVLCGDSIATYVYPTDYYPFGQSGISTGDHRTARWGGEEGDEIERVWYGGNTNTTHGIAYLKLNPSDDNYVHIRYMPDDPAAWVAAGEAPEERESSGVNQSVWSILVLNNVDQSDPLGNTYRSSVSDTEPYTPDSDPWGITSNLSTSTGQLTFTVSAAAYTVGNEGEAERDHVIDPTSGSTSLITQDYVWQGDTGSGPIGQGDEWTFDISYKAAGSSTTSVGGTIDWDNWEGYWTGSSLVSFATIALSINETEYCHYVAVPTPEDNNDLPDADQIRAGNDGFDSPALDAQSRGPDADGTVRFDPFSDESILPGTDITLCYVWEDESFPVYYEITTAGAIYHVAVETPVDDNDLPDGVQIQAGTDGYDDPAVDVQVKPLPGSSGTVTFDAFAGADPDTDYTLCFVYSPDGTTFETPLYYDLSTLEGDINVSATTDSLTLTEYSATISLDVEILANKDSLTLSEYPANINSSTNIQASEYSLTLTTYDAAISSGTTNVNASTAILNLVSYNATVQGIESAGYTGGWSFFNAFDVERRRALSLRKKRKELLDRSENIEDTLDRALAIEIQKQEFENDRQAELRRLGNLAQAHREHITEELYGDRVVTALSRAIAQGNYSALEALEREMIRIKEEEEFLLTAARIFYYHDRPN